MELPNILSQGVFLDLLKRATIEPSQCEESDSLCPHSYGELRFSSGDLCEFSDFASRQEFSKFREVVVICVISASTSSKIETAVEVIEAHSE